jgi:hypothetical protein
VRIAAGEGREPDQSQQRIRPPLPLERLGDLAEAEPHVLVHREPREQAVLLEHHAERRRPIHAAARRRQPPRAHVEQRCLAAPGGADNRDELAVTNLQVDPGEHVHLAVRDHHPLEAEQLRGGRHQRS